MRSLLAPRELEYAKHVVNGESDKEIARGMNLTLSSVKSTGRRVRWKLSAENRTEVAVHAIREGLVAICLMISLLNGSAENAIRVNTRLPSAARTTQTSRRA